MTANLFALCRGADGSTSVKRVGLTQGVQDRVIGVFRQQAADFLAGVEDEIEFGDGWNPSEDEVLTLDAPTEAHAINLAIANPLGADMIDAVNFSQEGIRALFIPDGPDGTQRVLMQSFSPQQLLERSSIALIFDQNRFRELRESAFTIGSKLVAIIEGDKVKFKSFHMLKRVFELSTFYVEATDAQIEDFCQYSALAVEDVDLVKAACTQPMRRLIHAIDRAGVVKERSPKEIVDVAAALGLVLETNDEGLLVLPTERKRLKAVLSFLDDRIYEGPMSATRLVASGKRPYQ